jgi:hypothetical protein
MPVHNHPTLSTATEYRTAIGLLAESGSTANSSATSISSTITGSTVQWYLCYTS